MALPQPEVGSWYYDPTTNSQFEVVAVDEDGNVEIQFFDGSIEEFEKEVWFELKLSPAAQPEDWTGPYEVVEPDDQGYHDTGYSPNRWGIDPLSQAEAEMEADASSADIINFFGDDEF